MDLVSSLHQLALVATSRPSPPQFARALAVQVLQEFDATYVHLLLLDAHGRLSTAASFPEGQHQRCPLGHQGPSMMHSKCPAQERRRPMACRGAGRTDDLDPSAAPASYVTCMPLLRHGLLIGSLIVGTSVNPRPEHHPEFWETIAICCAALLAEPGLLAAPSERTDVQAPGSSLSPRQRQILALVAEGMTNLQIGNRLGYSESTIGHDLVAAYGRLGVRNREDAVRALMAASLEPATT